MSLYPPSAVERMMKLQEVILRAMSGELTWVKAAEIIGCSPRTMRRWKRRYERDGYDGLYDRRRQRPSPKRASVAEVSRLLRLYRERYHGYNVRHFTEVVRAEHGVTLSYSFIKKALQTAGLVKKAKKRGPHRVRREPKACVGEMLHIDGSSHAWLALAPESRATLIVLLDDATRRLLYAQLWPEETTVAILTALKTVVAEHGIPMALYSDRASWAFYTPEAGGKVDKDTLTEVGEVLKRLGVEHIPAYSPQARGRSERVNRTLQDRLVNELRVAGCASIEAANRYLRERYIPQHNAQFTVAPKDTRSAFVSLMPSQLERSFCFESERVVAKDNTISYHSTVIQIAKQPGRVTMAKRKIVVCEFLDGTLALYHGIQCLGRYDAQGQPLTRHVPTQQHQQAA